MTDPTPLADLAARLRAATGEDGDGHRHQSQAVRFVVATDWNSAAAPIAVLRAYRAVFASVSPVELCFAVPHEPSQRDAECVRVLVEGVGDEAVLGPLAVESFDEVLASPYDSAAVPVGDPELLLTEVAGLITRMFDVSRRLGADSGGMGANQGDVDALRHRLGDFVG